MSDYAELLDKSTVRIERLLPGPIQRVWAHLTKSDKRATWLCGGDVEERVGGHVDMNFHNASLSDADDISAPEKYKDMPEKVSFTGKVTRYEPWRALAYTWESEDDGTSEILFELEERDDKVHLVATHTDLKPGDFVLGVCGGWHTHLDILADVLEGREPKAFWKTHTALEAEYQDRLG